MVRPINAGAALVGLLVCAVQCKRMERGRVIHFPLRIFLAEAVNGDAAGVNNPLERRAAGRLENIHRANHVDPRAKRRVGLAEGDLECREMDQVGGARVLDSRLGRDAGSVAPARLGGGRPVGLRHVRVEVLKPQARRVFGGTRLATVTKRPLASAAGARPR